MPAMRVERLSLLELGVACLNKGGHILALRIMGLADTVGQKVADGRPVVQGGVGFDQHLLVDVCPGPSVPHPIEQVLLRWGQFESATLPDLLLLPVLCLFERRIGTQMQTFLERCHLSAQLFFCSLLKCADRVGLCGAVSVLCVDRIHVSF